MIEKLQHRIDICDAKGERVSVPCDSDRAIVVALVPVDGKLAFSDRLFVTHRPSGGKLIDVEFPPCDAGLERAKQVCDELLALPIDWSALTANPHAAFRARIVEMIRPIQKSAVLWVSNFWSLADDGSVEDEPLLYNGGDE